MPRQYSNNSKSMTLTTAANAVTTTIVVNDATGLPAAFPYFLVIDPETSLVEVVSVTAAAGTSLTVLRGQQDTPAASHSIGAVVYHAWTALDGQDAQTHYGASGNVHGVGASANVVGTDTAQTVTNKTMSGAANTFSNIPGSAVTPANFATTAVAGDLSVTGNATVVGTLTLSNQTDSNRNTAAGQIYRARVTGDALPRWALLADGKQEWGDGTVAGRDTNLYRSAANVLKTDDSLAVALNLSVDGDTTLGADGAGNLTVNGTGSFKDNVTIGSDGSGTLTLPGGSVIVTGGPLDVTRAGTGDNALQFKVTGDSVSRFIIEAGSRMAWGPGGATPVDTNLYRGAADRLQTDDDFQIKEHLVMRGEKGSQAFSFTSQTSDFVDVVFSTAFPSAPIVVATINSSSGTTAGWWARVSNTTTTGFRLLVNGSVNTWAAVPVNWIALL